MNRNDVGRTDTMIVATVNPKNSQIKLVSIPRDTYVEIVGRSKKDKINHAYAFGSASKTIATVEKLLDIPWNDMYAIFVKNKLPFFKVESKYLMGEELLGDGIEGENGIS